MTGVLVVVGLVGGVLATVAVAGTPTRPPRPPSVSQRIWLHVLDQQLETQRAIAREQVRRSLAPTVHTWVRPAPPTRDQLFLAAWSVLQEQADQETLTHAADAAKDRAELGVPDES
jgi:hypothetical protein